MHPHFKYSNTYSKLHPVVAGYTRDNFNFLSGPTMITYITTDNESYKMADILSLPLQQVVANPICPFQLRPTHSNAIAMSLSGSEMMGKGKSAAARLLYACMSLIQLWYESTGSQDRTMHLTLRLANSGSSDASVPSSVVQTGENTDG